MYILPIEWPIRNRKLYIFTVHLYLVTIQIHRRRRYRNYSLFTIHYSLLQKTPGESFAGGHKCIQTYVICKNLLYSEGSWHLERASSLEIRPLRTRRARSWSRENIPSLRPVAMELGIWNILPSRIIARIGSVAAITSSAATRPLPSVVAQSVCDTTPTMEFASCERI